VRTKTALVELLKDSRDLRVFLKIVARRVLRGSESSPGSLGTSWRRGYVVNLREVQDSVFEIARDLFSESPGADFVAWAGLLCGDALARLQERCASLSPEEKDAMDLSGAWRQNDAVEEACRNADLPAFRAALKDYEREALEAIERVREESGAA
jgi:hypothetical protein